MLISACSDMKFVCFGIFGDLSVCGFVVNLVLSGRGYGFWVGIRRDFAEFAAFGDFYFAVDF